MLSNNLVIKNNRLIEYKGRLTLSELRLFGLVMANVHKEQAQDLAKYVIDVSVLRDNTSDKNFYGYLKEVALKLENKRIIVESITDNGKRQCYPIRIIYRPRIVEGSNNLEFYLDKDLVPYILEFKKVGYTSYEISNILQMTSAYSARIYELLKQYEGFNRPTKCREFDIEELKEYLGIEPNEYKRFYDFERWVLKVAIKEINQHTDIKASYEKIKEGRRIARVKFTVKYVMAEANELASQLYNISELRVNCGLEKENWTPKQIVELYETACNKAEDIDVYSYIKLNYERMIKSGRARHKFAYLLKSLEEDYAKAYVQIKSGYFVETESLFD